MKDNLTLVGIFAGITIWSFFAIYGILSLFFDKDMKPYEPKPQRVIIEIKVPHYELIPANPMIIEPETTEKPKLEA